MKLISKLVRFWRSPSEYQDQHFLPTAKLDRFLFPADTDFRRPLRNSRGQLWICRRKESSMGKHNSKLTRDEMRELQETTHFNEKQLRQWYKDFIRDCPSGYMTKNEFKEIYGQFFPSGDPTRFVDYVFNVFDVDKNGVITFKEFILAISITTKGTVEEKLNWAFSLYDFDNDGYVSQSEMLDIVRAIHRMHGKEIDKSANSAQRRVDELFTKLDSDQDGKISREEFCSGFKNDEWIMRALLVKMPAVNPNPPPENNSSCPLGPNTENPNNRRASTISNNQGALR